MILARCIVTVTLIPSAFLLAGCSSSNPPEPTTTTAAQLDTDKPQFVIPGTVVTLRCYRPYSGAIDYRLQLQARSVTDWTVKAETDTAIPQDTDSVCRADLAGADMRRSFDRTFSHTAVTVTDPATGDRRAAALRLRDGTVVPAAPADSQAFDSSTKEGLPQFHPETDDLWFRDENANRMRSRNLSTGQSTERDKLPEIGYGDSRVPEPSVAIPLADRTLLVQAEDAHKVRVSPDGQMAVVADTWLATRRTPAAQWRRISTSFLGAGMDGVIPNCHGLTWISARTVVCDRSIRHQLGTMTFNTAGTKVVSSDPAILPDTDRAIAYPIVSPDGKKLIFASAQGETVEVFTVPADGSSSPVQVGDLPYSPGLGEPGYRTDVSLIEWN